MNWDFQYWNSMSEAQQTAFLASYTDTLDSGYQWTKTSITYSFASNPTGREYFPYIPTGESLNFSPLDAQEKAFVRFFFSYLESFLNLDFQEVVGSVGNIVLGQHNMTPGGYADLPNNVTQSGVFIANDLSSAAYGDAAYGVLAHEIGHALGLSHTRGYDGEQRFNPGLPVQYDTTLLSIMSYSDMASTAPFKLVGTVMPLDIAALMELYGARASAENNVFRIEDGYVLPSLSGATWTISGDVPFTVVDTGGYDVIDASGYAGSVFAFDEGLWLTTPNPFNQLSYYINGSDRPWIDLTGQTDAVPMIGIFQATVIEKFVGTTGNDHVYGNSASQAADGGAGTDTFYFSGVASGYSFAIDGGTGDLIVVDISPADGNDGTDRLSGFELLGFAGQAPVAVQSVLTPVVWYESRDDVATVAATWQLMMGVVPLQQGFEYLISSPANQTDLNDPYFYPFNLENTYLNFACNLAFEIPQSLAWYEAEYGSLSFAQAVDKAVNTIITAAGTSNLAASKAFFLAAEDYYEQVALDRIVRPGVSLDDATKVAMLSSVLYESVRADTGPYGHAVNDFADAVGVAGISNAFGDSLFG